MVDRSYDRERVSSYCRLCYRHLSMSSYHKTQCDTGMQRDHAPHSFFKLLCLLFVGVVVVLVSPCKQALAQGTLRSEIAPETGHIDDLFLFTVTFEGPQERITPQIAAGGDFEIQLLGPKTSISIINGAVHSRQQFVYQLTPKREGTLYTPEIQATINGQLLSAPPIRVEIKGSAGPHAAAPSDSAEQIFMRQTASPDSAFVGQQIVNAITVYTRKNLRGVRIEDDAADGFWQETISDGRNSQRTVNGVEYGSAEIVRALFALKPGQLTLPARKALAQVQTVKRGNPFGALDPFSSDFFENFFQQTVIQEKKLTSNELSVTIKPLPALPADLSQFSRGLPIVGETSVSATYSESPLKVGESKNIALVVASTGHLNPLKAPPLHAPPGVKIYDGQAGVKHEVSQGYLVTRKTFNYSVVPTQPGVMRIPGVSVAYFDPQSASYKLATTSDISLVVSGNALSAAPAQPVPGNAERGVAPSAETPTAGSTPAQPVSETAPGATQPYLEKSTWEALSERISPQLALLALAAAILVVGVLSLFQRSATAQAPRRETLRTIAGATTVAELEDSTRSWAIRTFPELRPSATFDEIRSLAKSKSSDKGAALTLIAVLDQLEAARYSGTANLSVDALKRSLDAAIRGWKS